MKIPVQSLFTYCKKMLANKWGYIWGTAGIKWTESRQNDVSDDMAQKYGKQWIGHMVADCSGVMVYIWKQFGLSIYHGSNSIARKYCGAMTTTPQPGYAAFKWRKSSAPTYSDSKGDYYHIGIVSEDATFVYESKGTKAGFVTSDVKTWTYFAPFKDVDYSGKQPIEIGDTMIGYVNTNSGKLNMREQPSTKSDIIKQIDKGEQVTILGGPTDGWYHIAYGNKEGYVSATYIKPQEKTESETTYYGVFIPCETQEDAEKLQSQYKNSIIAYYKNNNGLDG